MADQYEGIVKRRKVFFICTCPERPVSRRDKDILDWYMNHINNCPPRPVVDLHLPEYEGSE